MRESLLWTVTRVVGLAAVICVTWVLAWSVMDYGFATFMALGVGIGAGMIVWADLLRRRRVASVMRFIFTSLGALWMLGSVVGTIGLFI